jgi:hypothetical protein
MRGYMVNFRRAGTLARELETIRTKRNFRGKYQSENTRGVEKVRQAIQLVKEIMKEEQDPFLKKQLAEAGLSLNALLIR